MVGTILRTENETERKMLCLLTFNLRTSEGVRQKKKTSHTKVHSFQIINTLKKGNSGNEIQSARG